MSVKIGQAFIQAFIDANFGLEIAHQNENYTPTEDIEYFELINIPNDETPLSIKHTNETDGIFQVNLYWPSGTGAIDAKLKVEEVTEAFKIGTEVCYSGQCATVTKTSVDSGTNKDGWYKTIITIGYYANITR